MTTSRRAIPLLLFVAFAGGVYAVALYLGTLLPSLDRAGAVAAGVTVDLAILVPASWYYLVVRRLGWSWLAVVPLAAVGMLAAARIVPADHQQTLIWLEIAAVPLELVLLGYVGWRAVSACQRAVAVAEGADDPFSAIRVCTRELVPNDRLADAVADEISVLYGGLVSWWMRPPGVGSGCFTFHRRDAYASLVAGLLLVLAIELFPTHMLLAHWNPLAAWIVTGLSIYGAVWLIADLQAVRLRPIRLTQRGLDLRVGLRWDVSIALDDIEHVVRIAPGAQRPGKGVLNVVPLGEPTHRLMVRAPVTARGPYGLRKTVRAIAFAVDEAGRFDEQLVRLGVPDPGAAATPATGPGGGVKR